MHFPANHLLFAAWRRKVTAGERRLRAVEGVIKPLLYRGAHVGNAPKGDNSVLFGYLAQLDRVRLADGGRSERSQSFAMRSASHRQPLPPARPRPIFAARHDASLQVRGR